jgi:hypothetical protein
MLQKERNRKEHFGDKAANHSIRVIIKALQKQLKSVEQEIKERLDKNKELKAKAKVINSVSQGLLTPLFSVG